MTFEGLDYPNIPSDFPLEKFLRDLDSGSVTARHAVALTFVDQWYQSTREFAIANARVAALEKQNNTVHAENYLM